MHDIERDQNLWEHEKTGSCRQMIDMFYINDDLSRVNETGINLTHDD